MSTGSAVAIEEYGLSQASLEQIFNQFAAEQDVRCAYPPYAQPRTVFAETDIIVLFLRFRKRRPGYEACPGHRQNQHHRRGKSCRDQLRADKPSLAGPA